MPSTKVFIPTDQTQLDLANVIGSLTGAALSADTDPNTAVPLDSRVFMSPRAGEITGKTTVAYVVADNSCTVQLWFYSRLIGRWFKVGAPIAVTADQQFPVGQGVSLNTGVIPDYAPLFAQVSANAGGAKVVGVGFH